METVLRQFLQRFLVINDEDFDMLYRHVEVRHFPRRALLVKVGETEQYLNLVVKGIIRKYFFKGTHEVITQLADEGSLISSSVSFLSGQPSMYNLEAVEPVTVLSLSKDTTENLYAKWPLMERLGRLVTTELFLHKEEIELDHISLDVKQRFMKFLREHGELLQRVPQKYIASYLNIKPETFSRLKHYLKSTELIA